VDFSVTLYPSVEAARKYVWDAVVNRPPLYRIETDTDEVMKKPVKGRTTVETPSA
tara:strand:- start:284 stop:448 length:165 start_codon:yes stop_codon:yes gene_type:complete